MLDSVWVVSTPVIMYTYKRDSSVGVTRRTGRPGIFFRQEQEYFALFRSVQTESVALPVTYPMGTMVYFFGCKAAGNLSSPLISI
jgi:hypothetical protein